MRRRQTGGIDYRLHNRQILGAKGHVASQIGCQGITIAIANTAGSGSFPKCGLVHSGSGDMRGRKNRKNVYSAIHLIAYDCAGADLGAVVQDRGHIVKRAAACDIHVVNNLSVRPNRVGSHMGQEQNC